MLGVALATVCATVALDWWTKRGVLDPSAPVNDFAAANAGQLKWIAHNACAEMDDKLPGGAGAGLCALVASFSSGKSDCAINRGRLKNVARAFYERLIEEGYAEGFPNHYGYNGEYGVDTDDDDGDGLPNGRERVHGTNPFRRDTDGDGQDDWEEAVVTGTDPIDPCSVFAVQIESQSPTETVVCWPSSPGRIYTVMSSFDLTSGFAPVSGSLTAAPPTNRFVHETVGTERRYYFVEVVNRLPPWRGTANPGIESCRHMPWDYVLPAAVRERILSPGREEVTP